MKKCTCTALYETRVNGYTLHKIIIKTRERSNIIFIGMHGFNSFNELYEHILKVLKNNNYYVYSWKEFNALWYDVDFLNIKTLEIERFSYNKNVS